MGGFPREYTPGIQPGSFIGPFHPALGPVGDTFLAAGGGSSIVSSTGQNANKCIFLPFSVFKPTTVKTIRFINGGTVTGNFDVGLYYEDGTQIVALGSTAQAGVSSVQDGNITDTLLQPGNYYTGMVIDAAATYMCWNIATADICRMKGLQVKMQTSTFPLPSPATFVEYDTTPITLLSLTI